MAGPQPVAADTGPLEILYSVVARKEAKVVVLSEYTTTTGNFQQIARKICDKLPKDKDTKMSYTYDTHVFHMLVEKGCVFMCMVKVTPTPAKKIPFAFLEDIKVRFKERFQTRYDKVTASECYESFAVVLRARMEYYSKDPAVDKVGHVQKQVDEVKGIMAENVDIMLQRGERLELLVTKTEDLATEAHTFKKRATELKNKMWWRNCKMMLVIALPVICGCFWGAFWLCGGITFCNCGAKCDLGDDSSGDGGSSGGSGGQLFIQGGASGGTEVIRRLLL